MAKGIAERPRAGLAPGAARETVGAVEEDSPREIRALVTRLAWPSIVENMLQSIFNILIILMVSRLGPATIAGVGGSNQILMVAMACFFALSMGTTVLVAHATGARNREAASLAAKQSLTLGLIISAVITALGVTFAPDLLAAIGAQPEVVAAGSPFLRAIAAGSVFLVTSFVAGGALRGTGDAQTPMLVTFGMLGLNLTLAYLLIFGEAGLPALGVAGAGLVSSPYLVLGLLCLSQIGVSATPPLLWPIPSAFLTGSSAAAGIAAINSIGNLSGFAGPYMMGYLRDLTGDFTAGLLVLGGCALVGGIAVMTLRVSTRLEAAEPGEPALAH